MSQLPDFRDPEFLRGHIRHTLDFYSPVALDPSGGCFHFFKDDGTVYDRHTRHLVSSARFVFNHAAAWLEFGRPQDLQAVRHTLSFLHQAHFQADTGGYAWLIDWPSGRVLDPTQHAYGLAFVLLAHAHALRAGVAEAEQGLVSTFELLERRFWDAGQGLYADEADAQWVLSGYRGQNANMHACEAMLAAHEATGQDRYLQRAALLADGICLRQAQRCGGLIWEHYDAQWQPDWQYNRHHRGNIFRPWGYQVGHLSEWAKLLLILERHHPMDWLLPRAIELFDAAWHQGWDATHGGLVYGFDPDGQVCDADKYHWVQAETLAAAGLLHLRTGDSRYAQIHDQVWAYAWRHFVDHRHGAWYRILTPDNRPYSDEKSPAGKTDYHSMGACHDLLAAQRWHKRTP